MGYGEYSSKYLLPSLTFKSQYELIYKYAADRIEQLLKQYQDKFQS